MRHNLTTTLLYLDMTGVPKGAEKQKRQDAADARARQKGGSSGKKTRRRSQEFRDEED